MTETLPSPLDYFSDEEVPFSDHPDTFAYIKFDFSNMTFVLNVKQDGDDEYLGGDDADFDGMPAHEESVEDFIKEVKEEYGVEEFPESLEKKAKDFIWKRQYTEAFNVPVRKTEPNAAPDMIKVLYFQGVPDMYSGYLSVERGDKSFAGLLEDREMLTGAVIALNDALQDATEIDTVAKLFCLLTDIGRQLPGSEETYQYRWVMMLIPYAHPRPRLVEELLLPGLEAPHLPRVPERKI